MKIRIEPSKIQAIYIDEDTDEEYAQPGSDFVEAGTLINPRTDEDMGIDYFQVEIDGPPAGQVGVTVVCVDAYGNFRRENVKDIADIADNLAAGFVIDHIVVATADGRGRISETVMQP